MNRLITTTATVLVLLLSQSADAREARKGNHGADGKYREEIKAHMEEQRAENETFRAGLKNIDDDKRTAAIVEFREGQYAESVKFHEQIQCPDVDSLWGIEEIDKILTESDFVSLHCPLNDETRGMIGYERLCMMKESAYFINIARADLADEEGLIRALKENKIAGAGLDVFKEEPLGLDSEWLKLDNVVLTPHIATSTDESRTRNFVQVAKAVKMLANGEKPEFCVNL